MLEHDDAEIKSSFVCWRNSLLTKNYKFSSKDAFRIYEIS